MAWKAEPKESLTVMDTEHDAPLSGVKIYPVLPVIEVYDMEEYRS